MKKNQVLGVMMGAALLSGTAFAEPNGPQGPGPRDEARGTRPPCEEGPAGAGLRRGRPGQEGGPGMRPERRPEGAERPGMRRGGFGSEGGHGVPFNPERLKQAGATEQQIKALSDFQFEQQNKRIDLQAAAEKAELALEQLMKDAGTDEKAALKAADALTQARGELFKLGVSSRIKARQIIGEELLKKLRDQKPPEGRGGPDSRPRPDAPPPAGDRL